MTDIYILGYSDRISVQAGDSIKFMVSLDGATRYRAQLVRLINGDRDPAGAGPKEEIVASPIDGDFDGHLQPIHAGSHILIDDPNALLSLGAAISVHAFIMPTAPARGVQAIISRWDPQRRAGWALMLDAQQRLALWLGDGTGRTVEAASSAPLIAGAWY